MRPRFPAPEKFMFFMWPKTVAGFERSGVWERIVQRFSSTGHADASRLCNETLAALQKREREEIVNAILGKNYEPLWRRRS